MKYFILLSVPALVVIYFFSKSFMRTARRRSLLSKPFPDEWSAFLKTNLPPYNHLSENARKKLHWYIHVFLEEKMFEGCGGLEIDDEIRVTIAAQACLLLLGHPHRFYPTLQTILVYPSHYRGSGKGDLLGGEIDDQSVRLGESWTGGPIVLSWDSVKRGGINFDDGLNVTIHEFAHQLDQEDGSADGAPILENRTAYRTWAKVFNREYKGLRKKKRKFKKSVMNKYGATNPAEFFAVATEAFFEKPMQMEKKHPELFVELKDYYGVDPLKWKD